MANNPPKHQSDEHLQKMPRKGIATPYDGLDTLFARATRFETLWTAWEKTRSNQGAAGGDGLSIEQFERRARQRLSRLAHALRLGMYRPGPSRRVLVPKKSGGLRPLDIPCVIDRVAQGAVALTLTPIFERLFEDSSFAYRPGRSVADAVARVSRFRREGYHWVVDGDIVRYFESIPHDRLLTLLDQTLDDPVLIDLIALWLESHSASGFGVPQGSPLSPLLSNFYLDRIDEDIEGKGIRLVRFADDFVILCRSEAMAGAALTRMSALLLEHGLKIHPDKTRIVPFEKGFRFLGHVFVRSMVMQELIDDGGFVADGPVIEAQVPPAAAEAIEEQAPPAGRWSPRRRVLYVIEPGRVVVAEGEAFVVREKEAKLLTLPHRRVDRIEIGPDVDCALSAFDLAAASDTEIVRVDGRGRTLGRWTNAAPTHAKRHLAQAATVLDVSKRARLAQTLVEGRVANQRALLKRLERGKDAQPKVEEANVALGRVLRVLRRSTLTVSEAMGREGEAAAAYWPALAKLTVPWAFFGKRQRRTGLDPMNILFDITSSLLARDISAAIDRAGLHAGYGILHETQDEEEVLIYDLIEEFRAPVVEALCMALISRKTIERDDFIPAGQDGMRLSREGWTKVIRSYEAWIGRAIRDPVSGHSMLWRGLFELQADRLAACFEEGVPYQPYAMDY